MKNMTDYILVLDDDHTRHNKFAKWFMRQYTPVYDAATCIEQLEKGDHAVVFLDHDLGGETYVDTDNKNTGSEVVRWILANKEKLSRVVSICVHSLNVPAALRMVEDLGNAGFTSYYLPFIQMNDSNVGAYFDQIRKDQSSKTETN